MAPTSQFHRRIRKRIDDAGLNADVSADVNVVVSTGGGVAHAGQYAPIVQTRRSRPSGQETKPAPGRTTRTD